MISIIFPVYNEENNLPELYRRLDTVAGKLREHAFEFIFVDDCSSDQSAQIIKQLNARDQRVKTIRFARNCGSHAALAAGLNRVNGDCAIIMAADLQDPPELIFTLLNHWQNGSKVVWGVRAKREGESVSTKFSSRLYYKLMNWLTNVKMPPTGTDVFLADRAVIDAFKQVSEKHTSIFMMIAWLGFPSTYFSYVKEKRFSGRSKWTFGKKIKLALDSIFAFSDIPIRYMSVLGFFTAFLGFAYTVYVLISYINGSPVEGWSSLIIAVLIIGGIQMMMLGLLGEYLLRTFDESRKRPRYVIEYSL